MDTKSFLERVTASVGNYVLTVHKAPAADAPKNDRGRVWNWGTYDNLDDFIAEMQFIDRKKDLTAYFAVGTHFNNTELKDDGKLKVRRTQETAHMFKALCFDLDVGEDKPYKSAKEGAAALIKALDVLGFPAPLMVRSGKGLHCYWPLTQSIKAAVWVKVSIAFRNALASQGMVIDWSKIHDSSMVLRPVGSHHKKDPTNWKEVRAVTDCPDYDILELARILKPFADTAPAKPPRAAEPRKSAMLDAVLAGTEFPPVNLDQVAEGCAQVRALLKSGGTKDAMGEPVTEPLWRTSLGLVKFTENKNVGIERIAGLHPDYDLQASQDKMYQWQGTGPATCAAFERVCPGGCNGCPNKGQITSPAALTRGEAVITIAGAGDDDADEELQLPWPYLAKGGKIYREFTNTRKTKDAGGKSIEEEFKDTELVCPYLLWPVARYSDNERGTSMAMVRAKYPQDGVKEFEIPLGVLSAGGIELNKLFGNRQILLSNDELLRKTRSYLMTYLQEIQAAVDTSYVYSSMGWQADGSFLCGETLLGSTVLDFKTTGLAKQLKEFIKPTGSREKWMEAISVFGHEGAELQGFFFLVGAGGVLMQGSTIDSALFNMFSPESGAGKSITQAAICSCWGYYPRMFLYPVDTDNSLYKSFGTLNSLTPNVDEITTIDTDRLTEMLYNISQGREKKRMGRDAELRDSATWKAPIVSSSNKDLYAMVDTAMGSQAQKMRLFQGYFEVAEVFAKNGERIIGTLQDNYGHATPELVREILSRGGPKVVYAAASARFDDKYGFEFEGQERFIKAGFILAEGIGDILQSCGLIDYDYTVHIVRALQELKKVRDNAMHSSVDAFDLLGQYLLENNAHIVEYKENKSVPTSKGVVRLPAPDYAVARLEIAFNATNPVVGGRLILNKPLFKKWLARTGSDFTKFLMELRLQRALVSENERASIFKGCDKSNPGQAYCVIVDVMHPRLREVLADPKLQAIESSPRLALLQGGHA